VGQEAARALRDTRIRVLAKKYRCTHFLTSRIYDQPLPDVRLPVFGFVHDLNPAMPGEARLNISRWVTEAHGIFGISEFTRQELQRAQPAQAERIYAIPLGPPELKNWNPKPPTAREFDFYYPAAAMPHKNHLVLFQACVALARLGWRFRLALSGKDIQGFRVDGAFSSPGMEEARHFLLDHASSLGHLVEVIGELDRPAVDALYEDTRCVVLPSAYEGFGFPLAEATQRGIPVICSDIPAFREQLATHDPLQCVRIVSCGDPVGLAIAMEDFLKCERDAPRCQKPALSLRCWTWQDAAQRCFELLSKGTTNAS
jgi:glycosyltransferase involved in cell wall biosynthesis